MIWAYTMTPSIQYDFGMHYAQSLSSLNSAWSGLSELDFDDSIHSVELHASKILLLITGTWKSSWKFYTVPKIHNQSSGTGGSRYSCWRVPVNCTGSSYVDLLNSMDSVNSLVPYTSPWVCLTAIVCWSSLVSCFLPSLLSLDYIQLFAVVGIVHYPSKHGCSLKHGVMTIEAMLLPHETIFLACGLLILHVWPIFWCYLHIVPQTRENYYGFRRS